MRLELSREAQADLDDIRDFSVEQFGPGRAVAYLDAIKHTFRRILSFPEIGATRFELRERLRSVPVGEHRIFYVQEEERVLIVRVLHKRMDAGRHF